MKNLKETQSEIAAVETRIGELETQRDGQSIAFEKAQEAFISGKASADVLHAEQSKLTLVSQAIESLKQTYQKLKSAYGEQLARRQRSELLRQMATAANDVEPLIDRYRETRREFHGIVADYAQKLVEDAEAYRSKQSEFQSIYRQFDPPLTAEEIKGLGLSQMTQTMASTSHVNHPGLEFDAAISAAENIRAAQLNRAAQTKRAAEYNAAKPNKSEAAQTVAA